MERAGTPAATDSSTDTDRRFSASQWQLIWWSFRKHKLAVTAAPVLGLLYLLAICSEFIAPYTARERFAELLLAPPHTIHFVAPGGGGGGISANLLFVSRLSIVSLRYSAGGLTSGRGLGTAGVVPAQ